MLALLVCLAALITVLHACVIVGYILVKGIPYLTPVAVCAGIYFGKRLADARDLINTIVMTLLSLLMAAPLGIGAAIYLVEYAKRGNKLVRPGPPDGGDALGHPLDRVRPVRHAVFRHGCCTGAIRCCPARLRWPS